MTRNKHPKTKLDERPRNDLRADPGINTAKGSLMTGEDPSLIQGNSTFEGDVENDSTREGGVDPNQLGRTNK
jgi:hypothetical protein